MSDFFNGWPEDGESTGAQMSNRCECPRCGALELRSIRSWTQTTDEKTTRWTEYRCDHCGHHEQMSRLEGGDE